VSLHRCLDRDAVTHRSSDVAAFEQSPRGAVLPRARHHAERSKLDLRQKPHRSYLTPPVRQLALALASRSRTISGYRSALHVHSSNEASPSLVCRLSSHSHATPCLCEGQSLLVDQAASLFARSKFPVMKPRSVPRLAANRTSIRAALHHAITPRSSCRGTRVTRARRARQVSLP